MALNPRDSRHLLSRKRSGSPSLFSAGPSLSDPSSPYRWWEDEATTILWGFSVPDIRRLISFRLYGDDELPRSILQSRNEGTVTDFLAQLLPPSDETYINSLSHHEEVEQIIALCQRNHSSSGHWTSFSSGFQGNGSQLTAVELDAQSCQQFRNVPFDEWLRHALGYPAPSVEWFLEEHRGLRQLISAHLDSCPQDIDIYIEIEKHLRSYSPFAHLSMFECLKDRKILAPSDTPSKGLPAEFLLQPIRNLFKSQVSGLSSMLMKLSVLADRFHQTYHLESPIDWKRPFETKSRYLDDLLAGKSPFVLARTLTLSDEGEFSQLSADSFMTSDGVLRTLTLNWRQLHACAGECFNANPDLADYFHDCIKKLYDLRNYHSASAILHGLEAVDSSMFDVSRFQMRAHNGKPLDSMQQFFILLDTSDNYGPYRRVMRENPGVPFLLPHIKEYRLRGSEALEDMFPLSLQLI